MSASKFNVEPNGEICDVSPKHARASPNVKTLITSDVRGHQNFSFLWGFHTGRLFDARVKNVDARVLNLT